MKKLACVLCVLCVPSALAVDRITALVTMTNIPTAGLTLIVNSDTRTWWGTVTNPANEVLIGATAAASQTNLWNHIIANPFSGPIIPAWGSTNSFSLAGKAGMAMAVTATDWATVTYSTQTVSQLTTVRVPLASEAVAVRTNVATLLAVGLGAYSQAALDEFSTAASGLVGLTSTQTVSGPKTWTCSNAFAEIYTTNLVNHGNAISSPGTGTGSEQLGTSAEATNTYALAVGYTAKAGGVGATAIGNGASASEGNSTALGTVSVASGYASTALGTGAGATATNAISIGVDSSAGYNDSIAIGSSAATTTTNQIMLGDSGYTVEIPGALNVTGTASLGTLSATVGTLTNGWMNGAVITNATLSASTYSGTIAYLTNGLLTATGATNLTVTNLTTSGNQVLAGLIRYPQATHTSCANGANAAVDPGSAAWLKLKPGPTAAFSIAGFAGGADGRLLLVQNGTSQLLTLLNDSGVDPTATNRIITGIAADVVVTNQVCTLLYDTDATRWVLVGHYIP